MLTLLTAFVVAHATLFTALLAWPPFTAIVTAFFKGPSTEALLASVGSRHAALSAWSHFVYFCGTWGWDSKRFIAQLRVLVTPKPPLLPPPPAVPSIPVYEDKPDTLRPSRTTHLLAFAAVVLLAIAIGAGMTACGALSTDVTTYSPTPAQELGVVEYLGAEIECTKLDASTASKQACVHAVQCEHGRDAGGPCPDAGTTSFYFTPADEFLAKIAIDPSRYVAAGGAE